MGRRQQARKRYCYGILCKYIHFVIGGDNSQLTEISEFRSVERRCLAAGHKAMIHFIRRQSDCQPLCFSFPSSDSCLLLCLCSVA